MADDTGIESPSPDGLSAERADLLDALSMHRELLLGTVAGLTDTSCTLCSASRGASLRNSRIITWHIGHQSPRRKHSRVNRPFCAARSNSPSPSRRGNRIPGIACPTLSRLGRAS